MLPQDLMTIAWDSLRAHRLRTALSVLGIVIGIASFSLMYSIGETARQKTLEAMKALGGDIFFVSVPKEKNPAQKTSFTLEDVAAIPKKCPSILNVSPQLTATIGYFTSGVVHNLSIMGVMPAYFNMKKIKAGQGRLFSQLDLDYGLQVCVLGREVAAEMFPRNDSLGQYIPVNGYLMQVIGVLTDPDKRDLETNIIIPLPLAMTLFPEAKINTMHLHGSDTTSATSEIQQYLFRRFGSETTFNIQSQRDLLKAQQESFRIFEYVLWAIGSISLVVGGIGIMNIMLVSVTERTREIGIRRAVGATRREIKMQFLCEAIVLCVLGGLGGSLVGFAGSKLISQSFQFSPVFSVKLLSVAVGMAFVLGIICGTYPAIRAANQDPTIVLRYE